MNKYQQQSPAVFAITALTLCIYTCFDAGANDMLRVHDMVIGAIDQVSVPAVETGLIAELLTKEGELVEKGNLLARLDDEQARIAEELAKNRLAIAVAQSESSLAGELAIKNVQHQRKLAKQHSLLLEIAQRKANNDVRVLASQKSEAVANNELARATQARQEYADSISRSELDSLRLAYERTQLETQQAKLDREIDQLSAKSEHEAASIHLLNVERGELEVARALGEDEVAKLQIAGRKHEANLASLIAKRHRITAPINGTVAEVYRKLGEWVQVGEPVLRIVRLDRLRAEGFASAEWIYQLKSASEAELTIHIPGRDDIRRNGQIVFVSPEIDSVNSEVRFWVEFDNPDRDVLPGMRLSLSLQVKDE